MLGHVRNLGNVREDIPLREFAVYLERKSQGQSKGASCGVLGDFRGEGPMLHLREEQRDQRRKQSQRGRTGCSLGYPHPNSAGRKAAREQTVRTATGKRAVQGRAPAWDLGDLGACPLSLNSCVTIG